MSLPPEQISIKRRREEEPVDTLYIQSDLHQTKRRFTDFVFQRVQVSAKDLKNGSPSASPVSAAQRSILTPRSVSTSLSPAAPNRATGGVPLVRATSPGAELREEKRLAALRKEAEEKVKRALNSSPGPAQRGTHNESPGRDSVAKTPAAGVSSTSSARGSSASSPSRAQSLRRFQISRSSTPMSPLRSSGGGVQKRKADGVAVLVEKLRRKPHSRQASLVADAAVRADDVGSRDGSDVAEEQPVRLRKRPVVNQAERKWREERKGAILAAKKHISQVLEQGAQARHSNWEDESERLARDFEQIALELEEEMDLETEVSPAETKHDRQSIAERTRAVMPKPPLKYPPRTPNKLRAAGSAERTQGAANPEGSLKIATPAPHHLPSAAGQDDDSDGEYVYDTYIRRPLPDGGQLTNPLADLELNQDEWFRQQGIDTSRQDIGVIVITPEDEEYWEHFAEEDDDEDQWDSEDGDSNAENNPANDYPDEELSWDDEEDDPQAVYSKYRRHQSDDEEFNFDDSSSERFGYGYGYGDRQRAHVDSDDESW
ncbi:hypothetical protein F9C07_10041 [Aspergillus flavus]|uniref:Uncharacterized protein n=2 Tax=Aspergillus flavus TaxID=5059 RepID=B8NNT2_ASPFN|nr:uncharacterized protein G4B84_002743 [Aspergillus flavus NRRL3357]KAB8247268.1 hypothetical protein BDV35DRAFT_351634 [Aspergillus flavus]KAF7631970.1 hypothetical protein AFLA_012816 [Aspergillus flavus NRRL3357]KAJ1717208.1 hypothetical protein NYO67_599 [Aspergillus flavus]QMW27454.1 hypothetical protein G4B84_002743 [Aspergillus flavus NRRL3357]QMW39525.1 hypothetical protein G4B11_002805 [Aspergillus flavus]